MPMRLACLLVMPDYKPGDQPPEGYLQWQEWAEVQHRAGRRQKPCGHCGRWKYPQEIAGERTWSARDRRGRPVEQVGVICNECARPTPTQHDERRNAPE